MVYMVGKKSPNNSIDTIPLLLLVLSPSVRLMIPSVNSVVLFVVMPLLFLWAYYKYQRKAGQNCVLYYWILIGWFAVTVVTSTDVINSLSYMKTLVGGFMSSIIMYLMASSKIKNGIYITVAYILLLVTTIWYLWESGQLMNLDINNERLDDEFVNANDLAYYLFYVAGSSYLLFYYFHTKKVFSILTFIVIIIVSLWLSLLTASRQILLIVIPYILICILFQFWKEAKIKLGRVITVFLLGGLLIITIVPRVQDFFSGSLMEARLESDVKEDVRAVLLKEAIQIGLDNPIVGVGPGNMIHFSKVGGFSHNSYAELFSNSGIIAVIIYLIMIVPMASINRKRYRVTKEPIFAFLYITCIFWILYNMLYVFYSSLWLISFYFLLKGISDCLFSRIYCEKRALSNKT